MSKEQGGEQSEYGLYGYERLRWLPFLVYSLYTIYMTVIALNHNWSIWVPMECVCGMVICLSLRFSLGGRHIVPMVFCSFMIWVNLIVYSAHATSLFVILGSISSAVVIMSLFDIKYVNYMSLAATILMFILNRFAFHSWGLETSDNRKEYWMQLLAMIVLEVLETKLLVDRKRQKEYLLQTMEELVSAQQAKDDFLANVSHEIRTPLNAILGTGNELLECQVSPGVKERLYDITISGRSLMSLVSDILDFYELENDTMEVIYEPYNISSVLNDVVNMAFAWNKEKKLDLIVDCAADIPNSLLGDSQKLYRIILNVVNNAIKFTEYGGVILTASARKEEYGVNLKICVQDTGVGMEEAFLENLESAYQQMDTRRDRRNGGVGLGLAISRRMVEKMGGHLHIESTLGSGTRVIFTIPQKALSDTPLVTVEKAGQIRIIFYLDMEEYQMGQLRDGYIRSTQRMVEHMKLDAVRCQSISELKRRLEREKFDFIFVSQQVYENNKEYLDWKSESLTLVLVVDREFDANQIGKQVRLIYRPMHIFSVASVLNGEQYLHGAYEERWHQERFMVQGASVLAVDDSAMNLKIAHTFLQHYGITIDTALSGAEAIEKVKKHYYDLIFMDHMMPEMDGVECMQKIHQLPGSKNKKLPIVALTANAIGGAREMLLREGFDDFVAKPIERSVMERVLRKYLEEYVVEERDWEVPMEYGSGDLGAADGPGNDRVVNSGNAAGGSGKGVVAGNGFAAGNGAVSEKEAGTVDTAKRGDFSGTSQGTSGNDSDVNSKSDSSLIDQKLGLSYFLDNEDDYREILEMFFGQAQQQKQDIMDAYQKEDWTNYKIQVHSLKGQSLTIGAVSLSTLAKQLQFASEQSDVEFIRAHQEELLNLFDQVIQQMAVILYGDANVGQDAGQEQAPENGLLKELLGAMDSFDEEKSNELFEKVCELAKEQSISKLEPLIEELKEQLSMLDFFSAADKVREYLGEE